MMQQPAPQNTAAADSTVLPAGRTGNLSDFVARTEIELLNDFSTARVAFDGMLMWGVILATLALAGALDHWLVTGLCFIVIASRQLALTHMVHDASHFRLFASKPLNDLVSDIFFAAPVMITTQQYRTQHLLHHKHLGHSQLDTDRRAWYSIRQWHFLWRSAQILIGGEALVTFLSYTDYGAVSQSKKSGLVRRLVLTAITNALLFAYCVWLGDARLYFGLWILPMFTLTMYLLTLRVIAEHQTTDYALQGSDAFEQDVPDPLIRTLQPGPLGRFFLGSLNFFYHHEHHLAPSVRYANLPKLHALLRERGYYLKYPQALGNGYFATLRALVFPNTSLVRGAQ
jgi:fatty acid desaturase